MSWKRRVGSGFVIWWGLINTEWFHQMTEQKREDPPLTALGFSVQGGESEALSVPRPLPPGRPSRLAPAPQKVPSPLPGHAGTGPASLGGSLRVNPAFAMMFRRGLDGRGRRRRGPYRPRLETLPTSRKSPCVPGEGGCSPA